MKTKRFFVVPVFTAYLLLTAPQVNAYEVTERHMTRLSDNVTMYTLTYKFGFPNASASMPIVSSKSSSKSINSNKTSSIILSTAPIQGNKYHVPMKRNDSFTLLVLEQHAVGASRNSVQVNELPVTIQKPGEEKKLWTLNEEELKDFTVPKKR